MSDSEGEEKPEPIIIDVKENEKLKIQREIKDY